MYQVQDGYSQYKEIDLAAQLCAVKAQLYGAFNALIKRREQRAEVLKARMEQHQRHQEGVLAYSIVNLLSEKS